MDKNLVLLVIETAIVFLVFYVIKTYNDLVSAKNKTKDQWSQIDIYLKRRADLIPNIVETVKGYANHEKETLAAVIKARGQLIDAADPEAEIVANEELTASLSRLFVLAEAYPELKADKNFIDLQKNLRDTEDKIAYARQFYNDTVYLYKNKLESFPANIVAKIFGFTAMAFFEADMDDRKNVEIKI